MGFKYWLNLYLIFYLSDTYIYMHFVMYYEGHEVFKVMYSMAHIA